MEKTMWRASCFVLCAAASVVLLSSSSSVLLPAGPASAAAGTALSTCNGTEGRGCGVEEEEDVEFQLDSEINRRLLQGQNGHISNAALDKEKTVCNVGNGDKYSGGKCYPAPSGNGGGGGRECGYQNYRCSH